jgi:hypothetical protein
MSYSRSGHLRNGNKSCCVVWNEDGSGGICNPPVAHNVHFVSGGTVVNKVDFKFAVISTSIIVLFHNQCLLVKKKIYIRMNQLSVIESVSHYMKVNLRNIVCHIMCLKG